VKRWLQFNAIGVIGTGVQLGVLELLLRLHVQYLVATAIATEVALLHNYVWHCRWTWTGEGGSLWRFHLSNGLISLCSNLLLMRLFTGAMGWPPIPSNLAAITITSLLNFFMASRWVFASAGRPGYHVISHGDR
jgi:putative flippase GtrA